MQFSVVYTFFCYFVQLIFGQYINPSNGTTEPQVVLQTSSPKTNNNTLKTPFMIVTETAVRKTQPILTLTPDVIKTLKPIFHDTLPPPALVTKNPFTIHVATIPPRSCTLFGKTYSNSESFYPSLGIRPKCLKCYCYDGAIYCDGSYIRSSSHFRKKCRGRKCESFIRNYTQHECADPSYADCYKRDMNNVTWYQNGCQYTCEKGSLRTEFIKPPWCQRWIDKHQYCATDCPDKEIALQAYPGVFTLCKRREAIVYNHELCDGRYDCEDKTDEENCDAIHCKVNQTRINKDKILWKRTEIEKVAVVNCSDYNSNYIGFIQRRCHGNTSSNIKSLWGDVDYCGCEPKYKSEFEIELKAESTVEDLKLACRRLFNISMKSMYYRNYLDQGILILKKLNQTEWSFAQFRDIKSILRSFEYIISVRNLCYSAKDKESIHQIESSLDAFASSFHGFYRVKYPTQKPVTDDEIVTFTSQSFDMKFSMDKLAKKIAEDTGVLNASIQSIQEKQEYRLIIQILKDNIDTRKKLLLVEVITSAISLVAVCSTLIVFAVLRLANSTRLLLHKNLLVAYGMFCAMLICGVASTQKLRTVQTACVAYVSFFHYFLLAIFSWMLLEGIHLLIVLVLVFEMRKKRHALFVIAGWGLPLLILGMLWTIDRRAFMDSRTCLNLGDKVWLIRVPVLTMIIINFGIGLAVLATIMKQQVKKSMEKMDVSRSVAKAFLVLSPLLGFFWIFSIFVDTHIVFAYISSSLNTLTGLSFFIFHCILDKQVQAKARYSSIKCIRVLSRDTTSTSRSQNNKHHIKQTQDTSNKSHIPAGRVKAKAGYSSIKCIRILSRDTISTSRSQNNEQHMQQAPDTSSSSHFSAKSVNSKQSESTSC